MMGTQYLQSIIAGLVISLSGSLPLGNLNVTAMQIAAAERAKSAILFAIGVTIVEMVYLRVTLSIIDKVAGNLFLFSIFRVVSIVLLMVLAAGSLFAVGRKQQPNKIISNKLNKVLLGALMSAVNPMQIPFWAGWITYLITRSVLPANVIAYSIFTLSAGAGTFIALLVFIIAGRRFSAFMEGNKRTVNIAMGCIFLLLALSQVYGLLLH